MDRYRSLFDMAATATAAADPKPAPVPKRSRKRPRGPSKKQRILDRLRQGLATNRELNEITFRYGARLKEFRDAGFVIRSEDLTRVSDGLWRFTLVSEPSAVDTTNDTESVREEK